MSNIRKITFEEYQGVFTQAQSEHSFRGEPIPEMNDKSKKNIEYVLSVPFQRVFGVLLYWGFYKKAAIQFYLMIKNHPLANGNKRMACYCLALFYKINDRNFNMSEKDLYDLAIRVVNSNSKESDETVSYISKYLKNYY